MRIKALYGSTPDRDLAASIGRSASELASRAEHLALRKSKHAFRGEVVQPRWTDEDVAALGSLYPDHPNVEIARMLGRSARGVCDKARSLGLIKNGSYVSACARENALRKGAYA